MNQFPPDLSHRSALFVDFDGTLVDIVPHPDDVHADPQLIETLMRLSALLDGAVAVITGRTLEQIDRFLSPAKLAGAGVHGAQMRYASESAVETAKPPPELQAIKDEARAFAAKHPRIVMEDKPGSLTLHYRLIPELGPACHGLLQEAIRSNPGLMILEGKCIVEVKAKGIDKGEAIRTFMTRAPFEGRQPVFVGDDVTDEDGFQVVNELNGIAVKIGPGDTKAHSRFPTPEAFRRWLADEVDRIATPLTMD